MDGDPPRSVVGDPEAARRTVRRGYDRASYAYRKDGEGTDAFGHDLEQVRGWLRPLIDALPSGGRVVDLGCGAGVPATRELAQRYTVVGVDVSRVQLGRARRQVPAAELLRADLTSVAFAQGSFDGAVCLYALIHVPLAEQPGTLARIREWLRPNGRLLLVAGHTAYEGTEADWLGSGATMYWSHADAATYRRWLLELGFEVLEQRTVPEGDAAHELFLARVP